MLELHQLQCRDLASSSNIKLLWMLWWTFNGSAALQEFGIRISAPPVIHKFQCSSQITTHWSWLLTIRSRISVNWSTTDLTHSKTTVNNRHSQNHANGVVSLKSRDLHFATNDMGNRWVQNPIGSTLIFTTIKTYFSKFSAFSYYRASLSDCQNQKKYEAMNNKQF